MPDRDLPGKAEQDVESDGPDDGDADPVEHVEPVGGGRQGDGAKYTEEDHDSSDRQRAYRRSVRRPGS